MKVMSIRIGTSMALQISSARRFSSINRSLFDLIRSIRDMRLASTRSAARTQTGCYLWLSPVTIIARLKQLANKRDMPYQSLLKMFLAERLDEEVAEQGRR